MELKLISSRIERNLSRLFGYTNRCLQRHIPVCYYQKSWDYADEDEDFGSHRSGSRNNMNEREYDYEDYSRQNRKKHSHDDYSQNYNRGNFNNRPRTSNSFPNKTYTSYADGLQKPRWESLNVRPFEKNFFDATIDTQNQDIAEMDEFRKSHNIILKGKNIPDPATSFSHYKFPSAIAKEISTYGFEGPTPIQAQGWPIALKGRDLVGIGQTGSGKTLGYIIPGLIHMQAQEKPQSREGPIALVLAPTRELVQQIHGVADELAYSMGMRTTPVYGGASKNVQSRNLRQNPSLCVATPGRLLDFLKTEVINMNRCTYLVVDEADRMLDMGFEPQIRAIIEQIRPDRQTLMWSATWPRDVRELALDYLTDYIQINIGSDDLRANPNITQTIEVIDQFEKMSRFTKLIKNETSDQEGRVLVFARTKRNVDYLERALNSKGIRGRGIHGDHSQESRNRALSGFRSGQFQVLVATDVASRGLDVDDITLVVNYDFPEVIEDYVHRIGRTGRAHKTGKSHSFISHENASVVKDLIKVLKDSNQDISEDLMSLQSSFRPARKNRKYG